MTAWIHGLTTLQVALLAGVAATAGIVRGFTGGAGSNIILAPGLSIVLGPRHAIPLVLLLAVTTSIQLIPGAARQARWREVVPLGMAAWAGIPLGAYALLSIDQELMRRVVACAALACTLLLLTGWRYRGRQTLPITFGVGAFVGFLSGSVAIAGPPLYLYLLSRDSQGAVIRADFIVFSAIMQTVTLGAFAVAGIFDRRMLAAFFVMVVPFAVAIQIGSGLFRRVDDKTFRRVALGVMLSVSLAALLA